MADEQSLMPEADAPAVTAGLSDASAVPGEMLPYRLAKPWQRFWARYLDLAWQSALLGLVLGFLLPDVMSISVFEGPAGDSLLGIAMLPFVLLLDAAVMRTFGSTPGKALVGLKVLKLDGGKPTFSALAERNFSLWLAGFGLGIGIVALFTFIVSYRKLGRGEVLLWDNAAGTRCVAVSANEWRMVVAAFAAVFTIVGAVMWGMTAIENMPESWAADMTESSAGTMLDDTTRFDRATAGPGRRVTLHHTLMGVSDETTAPEEDAAEIAELTFYDSLDWFICAPEGLLPLLQEDVTVIYVYRDEAGAEVWSHAAQLKDCL